MISVERVEGKEMSREFLLFPWRSGIYDHDPAWVPPLIRDQRLMFDRKKGYFFEIGEAEFFLAFRDGRPVGRITAHVNHLYEEKYDQETGFSVFLKPSRILMWPVPFSIGPAYGYKNGAKSA